MATKVITEMNYRSAQTHELVAALDELMALPVSETTEADEELADMITDELTQREDEDNELGQHYDSPDIYDTLGERPSYAS